MQQGTVRFYSKQGFGFIDPLGGDGKVGLYFHLNDVVGRRILKSGDRVTFNTVSAAKGPRCVDIEVVRGINEANHVKADSRS